MAFHPRNGQAHQIKSFSMFRPFGHGIVMTLVGRSGQLDAGHEMSLFEVSSCANIELIAYLPFTQWDGEASDLNDANENVRLIR